MTSITEFFNQTPHFEITGGADYDFQITFTNVRTTTLDGKTTQVVRLGPFDFTGWSEFKGELRSMDGRVAKIVSLVLDGDADEGTLRLRGHRGQTWDMQQLGVRAGTLTIIGRNPASAYVEIRTLRWTLRPGSTSPLTPSLSNWTTLPT